MTVAESLLNKINELGISKAQAAREAGLEYQELLNLASGKFLNPRRHTLAKLHYRLGIPVDELLGGKEEWIAGMSEKNTL